MSWIAKDAKILVPFDFSDASVGALGVAREIAGGNESRVVVVHAISITAPQEPTFPWAVETETSLLGSATKNLDRILSEHDCSGFERIVQMGNPVSTILALAEQTGAALIVMPSHGRTGVTRLLMGSVAERVVRLAPCPVLVLRGG